jgi:hypothetical protein
MGPHVPGPAAKALIPGQHLRGTPEGDPAPPSRCRRRRMDATTIQEVSVSAVIGAVLVGVGLICLLAQPFNEIKQRQHATRQAPKWAVRAFGATSLWQG